MGNICWCRWLILVAAVIVNAVALVAETVVVVALVAAVVRAANILGKESLEFNCQA